ARTMGTSVASHRATCSTALGHMTNEPRAEESSAAAEATQPLRPGDPARSRSVFVQLLYSLAFWRVVMVLMLVATLALAVYAASLKHSLDDPPDHASGQQTSRRPTREAPAAPTMTTARGAPRPLRADTVAAPPVAVAAFPVAATQPPLTLPPVVA